jgi:hypothetical protein
MTPLLLLTVALTLATPASAGASLPESPEQDEVQRFTILPLPTIDVTPETSLALGGVALMTFRPWDSARPSQAEVEATLTLERQAILDTEVDLFLPEDRGLVSIRAALMRFPESYWGLGPETLGEAEERYDNRRLDLAIDPLWRPVGGLFVGPSAAVFGMWGVEPESPNALLAQGEVIGSDGGWSVGTGAAVIWEGRDKRLNPGPGSTYGLVRALSFQPALGSDFRFDRLELDGRIYPKLGALRLAFQGMALLHTGAPPFRQLALQGGEPLGRGLYTGRFRDLHLVGTQGEVRQHIVWRVGVVGFAGASVVGDDLAALMQNPWRPSVGGGLRVRVDDQDDINLRLDLAWADDGEGGAIGFYAGFGEAF